MNDSLKYRTLLTWILLLVFNTSHSKSLKIIYKGRIEFLVNQDVNAFLSENTEFRDSLFHSANFALAELESHLSYKISEPIRLAICDDLSDFDDVKNNHETRYYAILLNGNIYDIRYQIRYNVAKFFIEEYLMGMTIRERIEKNRADKIPDWLKLGFIQYFAQGITYSDFELFRRWSQENKFRNINFIAQNEQQVFGTVIWYLFEKEKGRTIDGAFWMLIKNANSFEKSFFYHFEQRFNVWLKLKIQEIKLRQENSRPADFKIKIPNGNFQSIDLWIQHNQESIKLIGVISNSQKSEKIESDDLIQEFKTKSRIKPIAFNSKLAFSNPSVAIEGNDSQNVHSIIWQHDSWKLFNGLQEQKLVLPSKGICKLLEVTDSTMIVVHQYGNYSRIISINRSSSKSSIISEIKNDKLIELISNKFNDSIYFQLRIKSNWSDNFTENYLMANHIQDSEFDHILWKEKNLLWTAELKSLIQESKTHLSFVRSVETRSEVLHLLADSNGQWLKKATMSKGDFYGQQLSMGVQKKLFEYFIGGRYLFININIPDEEILGVDTFKIAPYTFDSLEFDTVTTQSNKNYPKNSMFMSEFNQPLKKAIIQNPMSVPREILKMSSFRNWFDPRNSIFYLSNKDLEMGYSRNIPIVELYNSPLTLFYSGNFSNNLGNENLRLVLFTNFNRRRIGFSGIYTIEKDFWLHRIQLAYRQRQFENNTGLNSREQSAYLSHLILNRKKLFNSYLKTNGQLIRNISLNLTPENSKISINNSKLIEFETGLTFDFKNLKTSYPNNQLNLDLSIQNGFYTSNYIAGLQLKFDSKIHTKFLDLYSKIRGKYSLTNANHLYLIGGSNGWISSNSNTNVIGNNLDYKYQGLIYTGGFVRGTQVGVRMGNSFIATQNEIHYQPLKLIRSYILGSSFWKNFTVFGFFDFATAFVGNTAQHYNNPYNTVTIDYPNYLLTAGANRNPWVYSIGYGLKMKVLGTDLRIEFPQSKVGDEGLKNSILLSLGKNF